jgi:hypothetical protein
MAANLDPIFVKTPRLEKIRLAAANTSRDGSTGVVTTLFTAGTDGSRVDTIVAVNSGTAGLSSAMTVRIFVRKNNTDTWVLFQEITMSAITSSNTVAGATNSLTFAGGLNLPANAEVGATITVYAGTVDQVDITARGGDY